MTAQQLYPVSASKIGTWLDCPKAFWFRYVEKVRVDGRWAHFSMGNSIHAALKDWWEAPIPERTPERGRELVQEKWQTAGFRDRAQSDHWRGVSADMVRSYLAGVDPTREPLSCERSLGARTSTITINTRIDRIDIAHTADGESECTIVDYKTGKSVPTTDDVRGSLALAFYAIAVQQSLRKPCSQVALHHIPSGTVVSWRHDQEALDRHLRRAEQIALEMSTAEDFPATPSALCGYCDFLELCPAGQSNSVRREPWAGLPATMDA
jgi:RecB family exonuclease